MPALIERPKMSLAMWDALKRHIMRQREKKKQEQEADAAEEQMKRELEMKRKQDEMTIEDIKEKVARVNKKLAEVKEEKEQMFMQLKKVLHDDQARRREKESNNDLMAIAAASYPNIAVGHPSAQFYMLNQNQLMAAGRPPAVMYKVAPPQQNLPTGTSSHKRQRSPSPPPGSYPSSYNYKYPPPPPKTYAGGAYYTTSSFPPTFAGPNFDQPSSSKHHYLATPPSGRHHESASGSFEQQASGSKSHSSSYHMAPGYMGGLPTQMEHPKPGYPEDKYYVQTSGGVVRGSPVGSSIITLQPQPKKLMLGRVQDPYHPSPKIMNTREQGGITSGYPVRSQPTPSSTSAPSTYVGHGHSYQGPPPPTTRFY